MNRKLQNSSRKCCTRSNRQHNLHEQQRSTSAFGEFLRARQRLTLHECRRTWQLSTRYLPFQKSKTENWLESLGWETTIRTKDPKDCCSTLKVESAKSWFWTTSKLSDLHELQIYISPELSRRRKKRKWMSENKKAANQQRLRPKDHSTPKSNAGSTRWKKGVHCRKWSKLKLDKRASTGDYKQWRC